MQLEESLAVTCTVSLHIDVVQLIRITLQSAVFLSFAENDNTQIPGHFATKAGQTIFFGSVLD